MIRLEFILITNKYNIRKLSEVIGIFPCDIRDTFPKSSIAKPWWSISFESEIDMIDDVIDKLFDKIDKKEDVFKDLFESKDINKVVRIYYPIKGNRSTCPSISSKNVRKIAAINADFDFAFDWSNNK